MAYDFLEDSFRFISRNQALGFLREALSFSVVSFVEFLRFQCMKSSLYHLGTPISYVQVEESLQ